MLGRIFTDEDDVVDMVDRTLLLCVLMQMFDSMQGVLSGVLRGCGLQKIGTFAAFLSRARVASLWWGCGCQCAFTFVLTVRRLRM